MIDERQKKHSTARGRFEDLKNGMALDTATRRLLEASPSCAIGDAKSSSMYGNMVREATI